MKVKKDELPTEGVKIDNNHFLPGKAVEVSEEVGNALLKKGFVEVGKADKVKKDKEVSE